MPGQTMRCAGFPVQQRKRALADRRHKGRLLRHVRRRRSRASADRHHPAPAEPTTGGAEQGSPPR
jgi:hypothetical protein